MVVEKDEESVNKRAEGRDFETVQKLSVRALSAINITVCVYRARGSCRVSATAVNC